MYHFIVENVKNTQEYGEDYNKPHVRRHPVSVMIDS